MISNGLAPVAVPSVVGLTQAEAESSILTVGLTVGIVTSQSNASIPAGNVISQFPIGGTDVPPGTAVALVVSSGPDPIAVPGVVGLTEAAAEAAITSAGLSVGTISNAYSASVPAGSVSSQSPIAGTDLQPGDSVDLVVSNGPLNAEPVVVISSPADGTSVRQSTPVTFVGTAQDAEDGDLTSVLIWTSNKDGVLGSGPTVTTTLLSKGRHKITATATDGSGISGTTQIVIRIKKR